MNSTLRRNLTQGAGRVLPLNAPLMALPMMLLAALRTALPRASKEAGRAVLLLAAAAVAQAGGHVALMRHAEAPGVGDPAGFRLDDCATQRNLDARGRADAQAAGERLRAEKVTVGRLLASPWCRCRDTAQLMRTGRPVELTQAFGSAFGDGAGHSGRPARLDEARRLMSSWRGPGTLLVVTHGATIRALLDGPNPATAEAVVLQPAVDGQLVEVGRLRLAPSP